MIIAGALFVTIGIAALAGLSFWPMLLIGLGAGMVLSGVVGKFGWEQLRPQLGRSGDRERRQGAGSPGPSANQEPP